MHAVLITDVSCCTSVSVFVIENVAVLAKAAR